VLRAAPAASGALAVERGRCRTHPEGGRRPLPGRQSQHPLELRTRQVPTRLCALSSE
jgi:hypothetical protein